MSDNDDNNDQIDVGGERKERKDPPNIDGMYTLKIDNISTFIPKTLQLLVPLTRVRERGTCL